MTDFQDRISKLSPKRLALLAVELQKQLEAAKRESAEPVAVIGIGCRFPGGVNDAESYWQLLRDGVDAISTVPEERWQVEDFFDPDPNAPGKIVSRGGGFIEDVDQFDAGFFGITPREAISLDPRYRILMEVVWEALEHAAQAPDTLVGSRTGVFVGACGSEYSQLLFEGPYSSIDAYTVSGSASSMAAGRIAYFLGTQGPAFTLDTACSSSLIAVHLACQSLRLGECRMALAAGTSLMLRPEVSIGLSRAEMLSPGNRCRTFDAEADGIVRGEGCGVVILKRLSDAQADGDNVLAVIRGTAINQDGRSSGITAPNGPAQMAVIRDALLKSGLRPGEVDYIETHGTGTTLGDPIEVRALGEVFSEDRPPTQPIMIGSVKTNFGHLEAAAGIAALIKVVLALQHEQIPPLLHLKEPNPHIEWDQLPIALPTELIPWPDGGKRRAAGVSSFGFSGSNAHVILQEAATPRVAEKVELDRPVHLLTLSAKSATALEELARRYIANLSSDSERSVADMCFTANTGRAHFKHRIAVVGDTTGQLVERLGDAVCGHSNEDVHRGVLETPDAPDVVFMFTGQGSQYVDMGRELYETEPRFRQTLDRCDEILQPILGRSLLSIMYPAKDTDTENSGALDQTAFTQPALFALEYALADLWQFWGVKPAVVLGHSLGEYVAACVAGVFKLEDGLRLIAKRARLMQDLPAGGAMAAVFASEERVLKAIAAHADAISVAAINGPENTVISGTEKAIEAVMTQLESEDLGAVRLQVSHAFHSALLDPMLDELEHVASDIAMSGPELGLISNATGKLVQSDAISHARYWREHSRGPVRFADSMQTLHQQGYRVFIEIGPGPTLLGMAKQVLDGDDGIFLPSLYPGRGDWNELQRSLAAIYAKGVDVNWRAFHKGRFRRKVSLPTYPFERKRYWIQQAPKNRQRRHAADREAWRDWLYEFKWRLRATRRSPGSPADFLSSPEEIAGTARQHIEALSTRYHLGVSTELMPKLDALCTNYILSALDTLGWNRCVGSQASAENLCEQLGVLPQHSRLVQRLLEILAEDGVVDRDGEKWLVKDAAAPADPAPIAIELLEHYPECAAELTLTRNCAQSLAEVLTGQVDPMQLLFPGGSLELTEKLYQEAPPLRVQNALLEKALSGALDQLPEGQMVRILEIGAGTGSASSFLLPALPQHRTEYIYTDVSNAFLTAAKRKFHDYPFISYQLLDVCEEPEAQGYALHEFDIILAANVIHATPDIRKTMANVKKLLAPKGLLILLEATTPQRFGDLTVGLTPGWWSFADMNLRRGYALLSSDEWKKLFEEMGFTQVIDVLGDGATSNPVLAQSSVLIGCGPDVETSQDDRPVSTGDWLVLCDDSGFGNRVSDVIRQHGGRCSTATKAAEFAILSDGDFTYNPTRPEDFGKLLDAAQGASKTPLRGVLHLLALDEDLAADSDVETLRDTQTRACGSALFLIQAMAGCGAQPPRLVMVTRGAQSVSSDCEPLNMAQTTLWGLGRVLGLEHPELRPVLVDLDPNLPETCAQSLFGIMTEFDGEDDQFAIRHDARFVLRIAPSDSVEQAQPKPVALDPQATYLVTGGLAGLGLLVAKWLVDHGARQLILAARSDPSSAARDAIEAMERTGARILTASADVADHDQLAALLRLDLRDKPLRGIIHSAGVLDDGVLLQQEWSRFQHVMRSKVDGSWNLHQLSLNQPLDFFVLFSSGASFTGSPGQGNHAAANAFIDALAHHRRALGLPGLSINWGPWSEIGAAERTGVVVRTQTKGLNTITPEQGLRVLEHIFSAEPAQVAVLPLDPVELAQYRPKAALAGLYEELDRSTQVETMTDSTPAELPAPAPQLLPQLIAASPARRKILVLEQVQERAAQIMGLDAADMIDPGRPLTDLGLDSLMAVELRNVIAKQVGKSLPATLLFNCPTLDELTTYLLNDVLAVELKTQESPQALPDVTLRAASREPNDNEFDQLSEDEIADLLAAELEDVDENE